MASVTLVLRIPKGSPLTNSEGDANFQGILNILGANSTTTTTSQTAMNSLAYNGATSLTGTSGYVLRSDGTNATLGALLSGDLTSALTTPPAIGATTANTGAFTTLSASGQLTLTNASNYNIYASGAGGNYFAGNVGIGVTPTAARHFIVGSAITGSTTAVLSFANGQVQSDVTSSARYFQSTVSTTAASFTTSEIIHYLANQGTFGAGSTVTNQIGFNAASTLTGATNNYGFYSNIAAATGRYNFYAGGTADNYFAGSVGIGSTPSAGVNLGIAKTLTGATTSYGIINQGAIQSDVTLQGIYNRTYATTAAASFTLSNLYHFQAVQGTFGAGSIVSNQHGFHANATLTGATNNYGVYSEIASGTGRYNFYAAGTADNYFAGSVGIGTTSLTGYSVYIGKNSTGATSTYGLRNGGAIQSDVTSIHNVFYSRPSTAAAAFTLSNLYHYRTTQGTIGAGSAVTTQSGFIVDSDVTGATNNYGFYSGIAASTGRYNFYAAGTAQNVFSGDVGVGGTPFSDGSSVLRIGSTRYTGASGGVAVYCDTNVPATTTGTFDLYTAKSITTAGGGLTSLRAFYATQGTLSSAVTNQYGFQVDNSYTGATNNYGFISNIAAATGRYNFYSAGTADNYFAGKVDIGASTGSDTKFSIGGTYPSGNGYSLPARVIGTVPSTSTTGAVLYQSQLATAASAFTLPFCYYYQASQSTIGAGSSVTNQMGYMVEANLTGATNNYGFYSNIASGTGRYNFYAAGTADNYFAGNVGVGAAPTSPLTVVANSSAYAVEVRGRSADSISVISFKNNTASTEYAKITVDSSSNFRIDTNGAERMRIDSSGNVGVGTATPAQKLSVAGTLGISETGLTGGRLLISTSGSGAIINQNDNSPLSLQTLGTTAIRIASNQNVAIGYTSDQSYKLAVNGSFAATTKSFLIDHPTKEGMKLRYGSLESPYHGVRLTGEGVLINGSATIELPDYIKGLCKQEGSQVQITNIKHGKVIWVEDIEVNNNRFTVAAEVHDNKEYKFYWSFTAIRKDIDDMVVEF